MELLFESRTNLSAFTGHLNFTQIAPTVNPEPVLFPDCFTDERGLSIYGSVLRDGGIFRMWYTAIAADWDGQRDMSGVGYAESNDGLTWTKPALGIVDHGPGPNNLVNLSLHCPSVWIDPDADDSHRYRATGCAYPELFMAHPDVKVGGYYTAHSSDGLHWTLDSTDPRWESMDVITSVYHPHRAAGLTAMKFTPRVGRLLRRSIHTAEIAGQTYSEAVSALYPDEFDDVCAAQRGHHSCDYYGMGMLPAGAGTVGFLWNYWHDLPYTGEHQIALYGTSDVTLVWQPERNGKWHHVPGRPNFIDHRAHAWMDGWINTASAPVEVGDEHWLYFSGQPASHGFSFDPNWRAIDKWTEWAARYGRGCIGFARWPKWRLFGFESDPAGSFILDLGKINSPSDLALNYKCKRDGLVRLTHLAATGESIGDPVTLTGESIDHKIVWPDGWSLFEPLGHSRVRIDLEVAGVYAYDLLPRPK